MNVRLTDAPAEYEEVNVDVQGLRIHYTPFGDDTTDVDPERDGKWIDLPVDPMIINLLDLTNGVDTLLSSADLEPGYYRELRLILGSENTVMVDGELERLKVPSGQQSGYKIKFKTELEAGEELDVMIDFDAGRSVHKAGRSGKYILKPVLKAFVEEGEEATVGSISGTVEAEMDASAWVYAVMGNDTTGTQIDAEGGFMLRGLEEGMYDVVVEPAGDEYSATTVTGVSVESGVETTVDPIELGDDD
ncbi:DUF4382 domain-containing protein [Fodinibius sediminis]|nr:DUF4382 domain-containing protein [Fodinibius sediminis]